MKKILLASLFILSVQHPTHAMQGLVEEIEENKELQKSMQRQVQLIKDTLRKAGSDSLEFVNDNILPIGIVSFAIGFPLWIEANRIDK